MACDPCERGEHRFCVVGNCDFCPTCKRSRERAAQTPEPTPEQAVRVLKILGEWTRRGFYYEVHGRTSTNPRAMVIFNDLEPHDESYYAGGSYLRERRLTDAYGVNHFDALCQATTAMQAMLELSGHAKSES